MRMENQNFTKLLQFKKFLRRLENQIKSRKFFTLGASKRRELIARMQRLQRQLSSLLPDFRYTKLFAASTMLLGMISQQTASAQLFTAPVNNPFSLVDLPADESKPEFADIDADGDYDMFAAGSSGDFYFFENVGTDSIPSFAPGQTNPFGLVNPTAGYSYYMEMATVDIDADGDMDILSSDYYGDYYYFENRGTDTVPLFDTLVTNPWGLTGGTGQEQKVDFVDIDADGDYDLFVGHAEYSEIYYFENRGSDTIPLYDTLVINPFGLTSLDNSYPSPYAADIDEDGDFDLIVGDNNGDFVVFQNIGTDSMPSFDSLVVNPFGLSNLSDGYAGPALVDLDADGDLDLMSGDGYGSFYYFEQIDSLITGRNTLANGTAIKLYPNPATDRVQIEIEQVDAFEATTITVLNAMGQQLFQQSLPANRHQWTHEMEVAGWAKGLYFVKIGNASSQTIRKLLIE